MTYIPNTNRISTHRVDFSHQGLRFWGRTQNRQWSHRKVNRGEGREKGRRKEDEPYSAVESRHGGWRDYFMSRTNQHGTTRSTSDGTGLSVAPYQLTRLTQANVVPHWHRATRLPHESCQCIWRDSFISCANVTQMDQILEISFGPVHFSIFLKRTKIQKNRCGSESVRTVFDSDAFFLFLAALYYYT
jgi:hypothetical protein